MADFIAAQFDTVAEAAADCDGIVATAMSQFVGPSVAEGLGIPYRYALFCPDVLDGLDGQQRNGSERRRKEVRTSNVYFAG